MKTLKYSLTIFLLLLALGILIFKLNRNEGLDRKLILGLAGGYQGRQLESARQKVRNAGTNAIPSLLAALQLEYSPIRQKLSSWAMKQSWLIPVRRRSCILERADEFRSGPCEGFKILGSVAKPAIPALEADLGNPICAVYAAKILANYNNYGVLIFGPEIYTSLLKGLTNRDSEVRFLAANGLNLAQTNADVVVPALLRGLKDPVARVRAEAGIALGGPAFKLKVAEIIPALIPMLSDPDPLVRRFTSIRLGLSRASATNSLPALARLSGEDSDPDVRKAAAKAIREIEGIEIP